LKRLSGTLVSLGAVEKAGRSVILSVAKNLAHLSCNELEILRRPAAAGLLRMTLEGIRQQAFSTWIVAA